jgi:hypothetical protein
MADSKISALTGASALAGTEVLPIVQSSTTKKVTVDQILTPAAAKGINFTANTPKAGMTSQLLNWYEEGTFTPVLTPAGGSITPNATYTGGYYTRIGNLVTVNISIYVTSVSSPTGALSVTGLPFTSNSSTQAYRAGTIYVTAMVATLNAPVQVGMTPSSTALVINKLVNGAGTDMAADVKAGSDIRISMSYQI